MQSVDFTSGVGPQIREQLETKRTIWLTTVAPSGTPQPNIVWFAWDGEAVTIFCQPHSKRMRNLVENNRVSLNFDADDRGEHMSVITGPASMDVDGASTGAAEVLSNKYAEGIATLGMTPESFFAEYSVAIRIVPQRIRGF